MLLTFTVQVELAKQAVVLGHGSLSFKDSNLNQHARLVVRICGECLSLLGWDCCVSLNQLGHQATRSLQAHGQWSRIKQENIHCGEAPPWQWELRASNIIRWGVKSRWICINSVVISLWGSSSLKSLWLFVKHRWGVAQRTPPPE